MSEQEQTLENHEQHQYGDDLLAPEQPREEAVRNPDVQGGQHSAADAEAGRTAEPERGATAQAEGEQAAAAEHPADPTRRVVRALWALVAVTLIVALVVLSGWLRVTSAVNKVSCIEKAQANFNATAGGSNTSAQQLGLARLALNINLSKCH